MVCKVRDNTYQGPRTVAGSPMKRAFIYARTSTERQQDDTRHSIDSQIAQAKEFLKNYPEYELQETIVDATSAYSGSHLDAGLGDFLKQAESGSYVDDMLLVVYTDRLTRLPLDDAFDLLKRIARAKVNLAITSLGALIRHDELLDFGLRMTLTSLFHIAHTDSKIKSDRIRAAFATRAEKIRTGVKVIKTSGIPSWITVEDNSYVLDEEKAKVIQFIFEQKIRGLGGFRIAKALTEMGTTPFTSTGIWTRSYVDKILQSVSTYGAYQVIKTENATSKSGNRTRVIKHYGEPIEGFYPAAITKETFVAAQYSISITPKGRVSTENPFRGLLKCYCCGGNMSITKSKNLYYLRCNSYKEPFNRTCTAKGVRFDVVKQRILLAISKISLPTLESTKPDVIALKLEIQNLERAITNNRLLIDAIKDAAIVGETIKKIQVFSDKKNELENELYRVSSETPDIAAFAVDIDSDPEKFNKAMLEVFESITVDKRYMSFQLRGIYGHLWEPVEIDWESSVGTEEDRLESMADFLEFMQVVSNHKS